jgi:hypothetical protein
MAEFKTIKEIVETRLGDKLPEPRKQALISSIRKSAALLVTGSPENRTKQLSENPSNEDISDIANVIVYNVLIALDGTQNEIIDESYKFTSLPGGKPWISVIVNGETYFLHSVNDPGSISTTHGALTQKTKCAIGLPVDIGESFQQGQIILCSNNENHSLQGLYVLKEYWIEHFQQFHESNTNSYKHFDPEFDLA